MKFTDLPVDLLLDHLLPALPLSSLLALTCTCKSLANLCQDQVLWKRRLEYDYNFSPASQAARTTGFKIIYKGIRHPRVFVWGATGQGRLGLGRSTTHVTPGANGVPFPVELPIKARIVSIVGGGWSFHALDDEGNIYVWGQMNGEQFAMRIDGFDEPAKMAPVPHRLRLPVRMKEVSCGRLHAAALDVHHRVWIITNWARPCRLASNVVCSPEDQHTVIQAECGWGFVSMLTKNGSVYVIWPFMDDFARINIERNTNLNIEGNARVQAVDGVIPCSTIDIDAEPILLPDLPKNLPSLNNASGPTKLVRIAAGDNFIIGLTNGGHVLSIDISREQLGGPQIPMDGLRQAFVRGTITWKYLPEFSDINVIRNAPAFTDEVSPRLEAPTSLKITHISAHFNTITVYAPASGSIVLIGTKKVHPITGELSFTQDIPPSLQNRGVMSVMLGDYHHAALTSEGSLFTWGKFSDGALGLGDPRELEVGVAGGYATQQERDQSRQRRMTDPPDVSTPTEVRFDWHGESKRSFCFAATAAGWHTAALIVDLDGREAMYSEVKEPKIPGAFPQGSHPLPRNPFDPPTDQNPQVPIRPTGGPFRIGLAGGMGRGLNPNVRRPADGSGQASG